MMVNPTSLTQMVMLPWLVSELIVFRSDHKVATGRRRDGFSRPLIFIAMGLAAFLAFGARARGQWLLPGPPLLWTVIGATTMVAGIVLRQRAVRYLGAYFRTHVTMLDDHRLISDGPYARVRHPSYTGGMLSCIAVGLALGSGASLLAMTLIPLAGFVYRMRVEEHALADYFGAEWVEFRARTKALIPLLW